MEISAKQYQQYQGKSVPYLLKLAEKHFNAYIRKRDSNGGIFQCISCAQHKSVEMLHAGHYRSAGHHAAIRFHEDNVNGQCSRCNTFLHGNESNYRLGLIKKIGEGRVLQLEATGRQRHKWDRLELVAIIETYKNKQPLTLV